MIRLIGIDVDGTLVGASGTVHPAIWQAADRARAAGIHLALCSGRPAFGTAVAYARQLESGGWHVFQNGASVVHLDTAESRSAPLPRALVQGCIDRARSTGQDLELYSDSEYAIESRSEWARDHAGILGVPFEPRPLESLDGTVVRAQWLMSSDDAEHFLSEPHEGLDVAQSSSPLMPGVHFIGMTRAGTNKGSALRAIAAAYGVDLRDVMYVGDAPNDLPALKIVGHPVAMGNAAPVVRAAAERSVGHVDDAGLAQALGWAVA